MTYPVLPAAAVDLPAIYQLFEAAILFQQQNGYIGWKTYDQSCLENDCAESRLFKLTDGNQIVAVFSICYTDPLIWQEKEKGDALYIHRIVLNQQYKGIKAFRQILNWAIKLAGNKQLNYIRMDTWAENQKIIDYYRSYGFEHVKNHTTADTPELPVQHRNLHVALLEYRLIARKKINLPAEMASINRYWNQKIIGEANGQLIKLARGIGEIHWHRHDDQDELFLLLNGHLTIQLRDQDIELFRNDLFIVPRGVEHCPKAHGEVEFLIMGLNITSNKAGGRPEEFENN